MFINCSRRRLPLERKKKDREGEAAGSDKTQQGGGEFSPNTVGSGNYNARSEYSSGLSPSGFALLPMQGQLFDMALKGIDQ